MEKYCFLNGEILLIDQAKIGVSDIGVLRGYGVFDLLRTYDLKPFLLKEHLERLFNSAEALGIEVPKTEPEITDVIKELIKKNNCQEDVTIRLVLTGGSSQDGLHFNSNQPTFFILIGSLPKYPSEFYINGIKLITHQFQRELPEVKTIDYLTAVKLQPLLKKEGAQEVLYTSQRQVLECSSSNFFAVIKGKLVTPKDDVLIGCTRNYVIDLAKKEIGVEERAIAEKELAYATEAFITSTTRTVMPVVKINSRKVGKGRIGGKTSRLMESFQRYKIK